MRANGINHNYNHIIHIRKDSVSLLSCTSDCVSIKMLYILKCRVFAMLVLFYGLVMYVTGYPEQIHISYGRDAHSMVIMWATRTNVIGLVKYGTSAAHLQFSSGSDVEQLPAQDTKAAKYIHRVELQNLTEGVRYYYKVAGLERVNTTLLSTSDLYDFKVPHSELKGTLKFLVYGDLGVNEKIPTYGALERHVAQDQYAAILHVGDLAYDLHTDNGRIGDLFLNKIQPIAAKVPYMTCPGNHENFVDVVHYRTRFSSPGSPWPMPLNKLWYSFDLGPVHFISYSTEVFFYYNQQYACTQFDWLLKDLITANKNRDKTPWIIAIGHRPMYCSNEKTADCTDRFYRGWVKHGLEDLFHAQGVDLILQGHKHSYERLWPMYKGRVTSFNYINPRATTQVTSGAAGNLEGVAWMSKGKGHQWSAFKADESSLFSFGKMEIFNKTHLNFKQISAVSGEIIDSFWLVQNKHGPFVQNVDCSGTGKHSSCYCPYPFFYVIDIVILAAASIVAVCAIIYSCYWCCRKRLLLKRKSRVNCMTSNSRYTRNCCVGYMPYICE